MIRTDGTPTIAWAKRPKPHASRNPRDAERGLERCKRLLAERTKRDAVNSLK